MKAIFINAKEAEVSYIETTGELADIKKIIGVKHITAVSLQFNGDHTYIDDEGRLNGTHYGFYINGLQVFGNGLMLGSNRGYEEPVQSEIEDFDIRFFTVKKDF